METANSNVQYQTDSQDPNPIIDAAVQLLSCGISVFPAKSDKTPAVISWKHYQIQAISPKTAEKLFPEGRNLAVVGGAVSGNLECLDFDKIDLYQPFMDTLEQQNPKLASRLVKRGTPRPGRHLIYRCESPVGGNQKLAVSKKYKENGKIKQDTYIETRGEGGYFLTAPSKGYTVIEHDLKDAPVLTSEEVELLHNIARSFTAEPEKPKFAKKTEVNGTRPGDAYNSRHDLSEILPNYGWKSTRRTGSGGEHWTRPGKDKGTSATLKDRCLYVFSTSTVLPTGPNDAFSIYTHYEHKGDYKAAAKALAAQGYGAYSVHVNDNIEPWDPTTPEWPVLNNKALPGIVGEFVDLATENSEADPAAVLATFLVRFGVEVGGGPHMWVGDTPHYARLAAVIVGASSKSRKGTSGKPVNRLFNIAPLPNSEGPYLPAQTTAGPFSSGEGIIYLVRDEVKKWNDKLQEWIVIDPGVEDKRLFILDEEFAGVLANTRREGNTLSMIIRQMWDNGTLAPIIKNNRTIATGAHIGWVSHITLFELNKRLDESEAFNGFANRILWVGAKRKKLVPLPRPMDGSRLVPIQWKVSRLARKMDRSIEVRLDTEAENAWSQQHYRGLTKSKPGLVGSIVNRAEAQVLRLAMIYALLDDSTIITLKHLESAIAFWNYCEQSAEYTFHGRQADHVAQKIMKALEEGPKNATDFHRLFGSHESKERLETAVSQMLAADTIISYKEQTKGRPVTWYKLSGNSCVKSEKSRKRPNNELNDELYMPNTLNTQKDDSELLTTPDLVPCPACNGREFVVDNEGGYFCTGCTKNPPDGNRIRAERNDNIDVPNFGEL